MTATRTAAHRAARSDSMSVVGRCGLAARGAIYLLVGILAVALAFGSHPGETDQHGALQDLTEHTGGTVLVVLIGIGLAAYALWQLSQAAFGVVGEGKKVGPRLQSLARAVIYGFVAVSAFEVAANSGSSQSHRSESLTAKVMKYSGGRILVGIVGAVVVICGVVLIWQGATRQFEKYLQLQEMSEKSRKTVTTLGAIGCIARGIVFGLAGIFVIVAAVQYEPKKAGGLDRALRELRDTAAGPWLLVLVAIGLILFGLYGFAEAKWRRT